MAKYHINPETGRPNQCTATVRGCKYAQGNLIPEHYDTKDLAMKAYEEQQKEATIPKTSKKRTASNTGNKITPKQNPTFTPSPVSKVTLYQTITPDGNIVRFAGGDNPPKADWDEWAATKVKLHENISGWNGNIEVEYFSTTAADFDEGQWYHPTPDEPYHGSDRSYIQNPSFRVRDRAEFTKEIFKLKETPPKETIEDLESAGLYNEGNYEAIIGGDYYGDEFRGFKLDEDTRDHAIDIMATSLMLSKSE